ncbi:MAG: (d)CMP kinase [Desulfovibrio sp.]|nr:MAG: (d)CMP kinase [Desulfovibrio sp.]
MAEPIIVTLDGPAGVGKTTLAKRVAQELGVAYLDTGGMFRATAHALGQDGLQLSNEELANELEKLRFSLQGSGADTVLLCNNRPVGDEVRTEAVSMLASTMATKPIVREFQKQAQQALGADTSLVAEGRDMGTVIFPQAPHKFFLDARPEERAQRRLRQYQAMGKDADLAELTQSIRARDEQDRNRTVAPLKPADDAHIIDTSELDKEQVFQEIIGSIQGNVNG